MKKTIFSYLAVLLLLWNAQLNAAGFQGLGYLPDKDWASYARAVSADGSVVVGLCKSYFSQWEAFRWTAGEGMQGLGFLPENSSWSEALDVSADGSVVIGTVDHDFPPFVCHDAFRWTESAGMVSLGWLSTYHQSQGKGVSADGSVVVGVSMNPAGDNEAFRWTESGGMVGLGDLPGSDFGSHAYSVSDNGSVVVGYSISELGIEAFRWTESGGMQGLGILPGGSSTKAFAVSGDGAVVVGRAHMGTHIDCFRWTQSEGMMSLGGGDAYAVSYDGSVIVGSTPFIWDARYGRQHLQDWLENVFGLELTGWTLGAAKGISPDGLTIVGNGTNPSGQDEAWIAVIDPVVKVPDVTEMGQADAESAIVSAELTVGDITHEYSDTVPKGYVTTQNPAAGAWAPVNSDVDIVISLGQLVFSTIHVDDDAPDDGNGMSWATAFINLQDALNAAESTDGDVNEIRVAEGVYRPDRDFANPNGSGNRSATFGLINGVVIKGGYAGFGKPDPNARDIDMYETILSGDLDDDDVGNLEDPSRNENSYHVVTGSQTDAKTVLDGFTITAGEANGVRSGTDGAGMYNYEGSPTLIDCTC
ncbi:MAG: PASTA domain-containing protein [Planctomycetota bacterium]|jgi:probable HAF family extracellular repeat protein